MFLLGASLASRDPLNANSSLVSNGCVAGKQSFEPPAYAVK